jgi:GTP diphosphokinase / guanosine-3',5'-bis(diphosphate) 3'-diphosphatase
MLMEREKSKEILQQERWAALSEQIKGINPKDKSIIQLAHHTAQSAHEGQKRQSNDPYISHPEAVMLILNNECGIRDRDVLAACLLHDTVEDTKEFGDTKDKPYSESIAISIKNIELIFNPRIAKLVADVSKPKVDGTEIIDKSHANIVYKKKLAEASHDSLLIKMADRLHNLRTLKHKDPAKQRTIIIETVDEYLPLFADISSAYPSVHNVLESKIMEEIQALSAELHFNEYSYD